MIQALKTQKDCEACVLGKMQKKLFPRQSQHRATKPYEIVLSDVCGQMQVESKGGGRYMLTFTDDFSRYTTAYPIKSKSELLSKFMEYVNFVRETYWLSQRKMLKSSEVTIEENTLPTTLSNSVPRRVFHISSMCYTVHAKWSC